MNASEMFGGLTVVNDECAVRLTKRVETGWVGVYISLSSGELTGHDCILLDEFVSEYRPVPWEWAPAGDGLEERYRWSVPGYRSLERQTRPVFQPVLPS